MRHVSVSGRPVQGQSCSSGNACIKCVALRQSDHGIPPQLLHYLYLSYCIDNQTCGSQVPSWIVQHTSSAFCCYMGLLTCRESGHCKQCISSPESVSKPHRQQSGFCCRHSKSNSAMHTVGAGAERQPARGHTQGNNTQLATLLPP